MSIGKAASAGLIVSATAAAQARFGFSPPRRRWISRCLGGHPDADRERNRSDAMKSERQRAKKGASGLNLLPRLRAGSPALGLPCEPHHGRGYETHT
jgi:hypothetical protein